MFSPKETADTVEYISLQDPGVDDGALTEAQVTAYVETQDLSLLTIKDKAKPTRFHLATDLSKAERRYLFTAAADPETGEIDETRIDGLIVALALRGWTDPPKGAPPFRTRRVGFFRVVSPVVLDFIGPEVGSELAGVLWGLLFPQPEDDTEEPPETLAEETEKN